MDCKIPLILAYGMSGYALASISYLAITKLGNVGTPFRDELERNLEKISSLLAGYPQ